MTAIPPSANIGRRARCPTVGGIRAEPCLTASEDPKPACLGQSALVSVCAGARARLVEQQLLLVLAEVSRLTEEDVRGAIAFAAASAAEDLPAPSPITPKSWTSRTRTSSSQEARERADRTTA